MRHDVREAWVQFLRSLPWDWFATFTVPAGRSATAFDQAHAEWSRRMQQENRGTELRQFLAIERQVNGTPHGHALIHGVYPGFDQFRAMRFWEEIAGGFARIFVYDPARGAAAYCAKYVTKRADTDLRPLGPWPAHHRHQVGVQLAIGDRT